VFAKSKALKKKDALVNIDISAGNKCKVLVVDKDVNFRTFFTTLFGERFIVSDAETAMEGLQIFMDQRPEIVCLGEGLVLMSEKFLARKIRTLDTLCQTSVYLCSERTYSNNSRMTPYDGIIKRSFVPEVFLREFTRVALGEENLYDMVLRIVQKRLAPELVTAIQQTFGMMMMQEISILNKEQIKSISNEVQATVDLVEAERKLVITLGMTSSQKDVLSIAEKILDAPTGLYDGAADAFGELSNTISGRLRSSFEKWEIKVEQDTPKITVQTEGRKSLDWDLVLPFQSTDGERCLVGVAVRVL
jgi:CheY-specific phosphatase CheX